MIYCLVLKRNLGLRICIDTCILLWVYFVIHAGMSCSALSNLTQNNECVFFCGKLKREPEKESLK